METTTTTPSGVNRSCSSIPKKSHEFMDAYTQLLESCKPFFNHYQEAHDAATTDDIADGTGNGASAGPATIDTSVDADANEGPAILNSLLQNRQDDSNEDDSDDDSDNDRRDSDSSMVVLARVKRKHKDGKQEQDAALNQSTGNHISVVASSINCLPPP